MFYVNSIFTLFIHKCIIPIYQKRYSLIIFFKWLVLLFNFYDFVIFFVSWVVFFERIGSFIFKQFYTKVFLFLRKRPNKTSSDWHLVMMMWISFLIIEFFLQRIHYGNVLTLYYKIFLQVPKLNYIKVLSNMRR